MPTITSMVSASQDGAIDLAVEKLMHGELVALPTETVYGLAADASNEAAVGKIFEAKGRPSYNPLICHVSSLEMAEQFVDLSSTAKRLIAAFWPGPLTLVCTVRESCTVARSVMAGLSTLAVRCPDNKITREIITRLDRPVAAPSANISGKLSPTTAMAVWHSIGDRVPLIIDDGPTDCGIESTIVAVDHDRLTLLRPGTITVDELSDATGLDVLDRDDKTISAPGQLASHYAPEANVILNQETSSGHVFIGFGALKGDFNLSPNGDLREAAHNLFETLRKADKTGRKTIAIAPIPSKGIGIAINDRLKRAAAPRNSDRETENTND